MWGHWFCIIVLLRIVRNEHAFYVLCAWVRKSTHLNESEHYRARAYFSTQEYVQWLLLEHA